MGGDEKFFAWLDGELSGAEADEMAARVENDAELQRLADQHRALRQRLHSAFDSLAQEPVPDALMTPLRARDPQPLSLGAERSRRWRWTWLAPQAAALAATLALGVFIGTMMPQRSALPGAASSGKLYAAAGLDQALDTQLAGASAGGVRIGITFRDRAGGICRSFGQGQASGFACRTGDRWEVRGLVTGPEPQSGEYRMAAGTDPKLAALIEDAMSGSPLDAAQERAARDRGWR